MRKGTRKIYSPSFTDAMASHNKTSEATETKTYVLWNLLINRGAKGKGKWQRREKKSEGVEMYNGERARTRLKQMDKNRNTLEVIKPR